MTTNTHEHKPGSFHARKAERSAYYHEHIKGWRTQACVACNGSGVYDHNGSPPCGACDGTGKETYLPQTITDIEQVIRTPMKAYVSEDVELHVFVRNRRDLIYQFIGTDDTSRDPKRRAALRVEFDSVESQSDWCFQTPLGSTFYLHQFETAL